MKKLSRKATLHMLLQGLWKGIQEAKEDPKVKKAYPRGLDWFEGFVVSLGKRAQRPNFRLTKKQVNKLNEFLRSSSGALSKILRKHIVKHCEGNQCEILSPSTFTFTYSPLLDDEGAEVQTERKVYEEFWDRQKNRTSYRDDHMVRWKEDRNQSLAEFMSETYEEWRGLPGFVKFYYDPKKKNHFAFATYNTF